MSIPVLISQLFIGSKQYYSIVIVYLSRKL